MLVPESRSPQPGRIDYLGVLLSIAGLVLLVYGIIEGGDNGSWLTAGVLGPIAGGLAVLAVFAWYESRIAHPALDVRLFRDPRLSSASAAIMLAFFSLSGAFFFTGFYTQNVRGYSPLHAGLLTIPLAAGQLLTAPRTAGLVRRLGAKAVVTTGLLIIAVALVGYSLLGVSTPVWVLEAIFAVQGCGMGLIMPPATEGVMAVVPRDRGGAGSAITNTSRQVAVALGVAVLGSMVAQAYRTRLAPYLTVLPAAARLTRHPVDRADPGPRRAPAATAARPARAASAAFVHAMHLASADLGRHRGPRRGGHAAWMPGRARAARPGPVHRRRRPSPALAGPADD